MRISSTGFFEHPRNIPPAQNCMSASRLHVTPSPPFQEPTKNELLHLSISRSGSRVLSVGGFPSYHLDVWDIPVGQQNQSGVEVSTSVNVARVSLGDRLTGLGCAMFPLNINIIAACGKQAVRLISLDPLPNHCTVRQVPWRHHD